jgi:hypothetical protein
MKEKGILFSTEMVKAILDGRKTQTRRTIKPQPAAQLYSVNMGYWSEKPEDLKHPYVKCPYGEVGDLLYVRETWADWRGLNYGFAYKADGFISRNGAWECDTPHKLHDVERIEKWSPSLFMPKKAARIWLKVREVRVERLHDISPDDAGDEGVEYWNVDADAFEGGELVADYKNYTWEDDPQSQDYHFPTFANPVDSYRTLWESINGAESWNANPWVWVISFEVISKTGKPKIN